MGSCTMERCVILLSVLVLVWTPPSDQERQVPDYCKLSPYSGPPRRNCLNFVPMFFYNSTTQDCEHFIYDGCEDNRNTFLSQKKCMEKCHFGVPVHEVKPVTTHHPDPTANSKGSLEPCLVRVTDDCNQAPEPGPCMGFFPQYFYNSTTNKCDIFIYGGCRGNHNRFESLEACKTNCSAAPEFHLTDVCHVPPETGPCKAKFPSLYYNAEAQRCEPFIYGGCEGNNNRFQSITDCMQTCHPEGSDVITVLLPKALSMQRGKPRACSLPSDTGPCRANLPRYFYNSTTHKCEQFIYGGCGGNGNKFVTARECNLICHESTKQPIEAPGANQVDICHLPSETGPCEAAIPRYYYNHQTQKCEEFYYGGCHGNENNFVDEEHCMKICKDK